MWDSVITALLISNDVPDFDTQICEQIEAEQGTEKAIRGERMQIGIRNEHGHIYRAFGVTGLGSFMEIIGKLQRIGLADELQYENGPRHGYDAIFARRTK